MAGSEATPSEQFRRDTTQREITDLFRTHVLPTTSVGRDGQTPAALESDWASTVALLQRKLRQGTYVFTSYRQVLISKGASALPRVIAVPTARDRVALKLLAKSVEHVFPESRTPMAQVLVGRVVEALASGSHDWFVRVDIQNFYPTIPHAAIFEQLRTRVRMQGLLRLVRRAISAPTVAPGRPHPQISNLVGVPQGLSISNVLAEVSMSGIDRDWKRRDGLAYFRFVDDILILGSGGRASEIFGEVRGQISDLGLRVHELGGGSKSQVGVVSRGFDFLGYEFRRSGVTVRSSSVQRLEERLVRMFVKHKHEVAGVSSDEADLFHTALVSRLDLVIAGCVFEGVPRGWLHYFSQLNDLALLKRLDALVTKFIRRFDVVGVVRPKSFVRAYWHIRHPTQTTSAYIPNFDRYDESEQRAFLAAMYPHQDFATLTLPRLSRRFKLEVRRFVEMLEKDISQVS